MTLDSGFWTRDSCRGRVRVFPLHAAGYPVSTSATRPVDRGLPRPGKGRPIYCLTKSGLPLASTETYNPSSTNAGCGTHFTRKLKGIFKVLPWAYARDQVRLPCNDARGRIWRG